MAEEGDKGDTRGELGALIDALRETGMTIPDEVKDVAGLIIAVKSAGTKSDAIDLDDDQGGDAGAGGDDSGGTNAPADTAGAGAAPMLMSDARAEPFRKMARRDLVGRIKALFKTGRVDRPTAQALGRKALAVDLSFTTAGEMTNTPLIATVEAYEQLPKGLAWTKTGGKPPGEQLELSTTRVDAPKGLTGKDKGAAGATDWLCAGLPASSKK